MIIQFAEQPPQYRAVPFFIVSFVQLICEKNFSGITVLQNITLNTCTCGGHLRKSTDQSSTGKTIWSKSPIWKFALRTQAIKGTDSSRGASPDSVPCLSLSFQIASQFGFQADDTIFDNDSRVVLQSSWQAAPSPLLFGHLRLWTTW